MDSGFREIHVPRAWCDYLATGFDFRKKKNNCAGLGSKGAVTLLSAFCLATLLCRKDEGDYFFQKFVCTLRTTTTCHIVSFNNHAFYFRFLANSQRPICSLHLLALYETGK